MGVILACFHLVGTTRSERDILNNLVNEGVITSASSDNSLLGMPSGSGPHTLLGSKLRSTSTTSKSANLM